MQRIAIDMDEVMADTLAKFLNVCNAEFGLSLCKDDLAGRTLFEMLREEQVPTIRRLAQERHFFGDLEVMPDSQEVIRSLMDRYEVFVSSAAMEIPSSFAAKFDWLMKYFPFVPSSHVIFCGDKSILNADYLIDDNERHFKRFRGEGILFSAPHNLHVEGYRRVTGWREVAELLLKER